MATAGELNRSRRVVCFAVALLVLVIFQSEGVGGIPGFGLETALNQAQADPLGEIDIFQSLTSSLKKLLIRDADFNTQKKVETLLGMESTTVINVKLVGFPDTSRNLEAKFAHYINAVNQETRVGVIASDSHEFLVKSKITVEVTRGRNKLAQKVSDAVSAHLESLTPQKGSNEKDFYAPIQAVPYSIVDEIIQEDLPKPLNSYTVYLLDTKQQERKYAYEYDSVSTSPYYPKCLGTFWMGKDRYLWVDLAAGPVEYGPATSGDGFVKWQMFPMASAYNHHQRQSTHLAELASMVWSASCMLFVPAVRIPVTYEQDTEVHIIHIQGYNTTDDMKGVDIKLMEEAFSKESDQLLLPKQTLKFRYFHLKFTDCALCAAGLARAQRSFTSRVFLERYGLFIDDYLDSRQLHAFLKEFGADLAQQMKIDAGPMARVLPVYILDMDSERQLLLDHYHQVIPFNDMVIAVRTKATQVVTEYSCNGRPLLAQTRLLERPVIGALLQTLWGVTPTHITWSPPHNDSLIDYRWALGQTPFGPFSQSMSLSFAQKDAAPRNLLYSMLNESISTGLELLETIKEYGGEKDLFRAKRHGEFLQRWSLFVYKLNKAVSSISHFDYKTALYFLKSADHDIFAAHNLAYSASEELVATMICFTDPHFPWFWLCFILFIVGLAVYVWFRRAKLFSNKKKRF